MRFILSKLILTLWPVKPDQRARTAVTKRSFICHALRKIILFLSRPRNMPILFIFVFRTIPRAQLHLGKSCRAGLSMRVRTKRFCSLTLLTRHTFRSRKFHVRFSKSRVRVSARLNYVVFPRTAASLECAAGLQSCQSRFSGGRSADSDSLSINFGIGAGAHRRA